MAKIIVRFRKVRVLTQENKNMSYTGRKCVGLFAHVKQMFAQPNSMFPTQHYDVSVVMNINVCNLHTFQHVYISPNESLVLNYSLGLFNNYTFF